MNEPLENPVISDLGREVTFTKNGEEFSGYVAVYEDGGGEGLVFGVVMGDDTEEPWGGLLNSEWTGWKYTS